MIGLWIGAILALASSGSATDHPEPLVVLRGEVVDADTGQPLPCRVSIQGEDGAWHFPESEGPRGSAVAYRKKAGGHPEIVEMHTTLSAHPFVVRLEPGRYRVTVERGKEYHPESREILIGMEPVRETFRLRRWIDLARRGWYSSDTHVHRTLDELPNLLLAEDVNTAFPLLDWVQDAFVPPIERRKAEFRDPGPDPIKVDATHWIVPRNTEYEIFNVARKPHTLGAFFVLNHKTPLDLGVPPVGPVARRHAHNEGALIELDKHNWPWSMMLVPVMPVDLFELSNNHIWQSGFAFRDYGEAPADYMHIERDERGWTERGWIDFGFQNYYALLDCGFRLRPTAGTASGVHPVPLGFGRVYVRIDGFFDTSRWLRALNEGRSFVTTGPMLFVTLDGCDPGHVFRQDGPNRRDYSLRGSALGAQPLERIEIIVNGEIARTLTPVNHPTDRGAFESPIDVDLSIEGSSWIAVRCFEARPDHRVRFAHTGPFHIEVSGRPLRPRRVEVEYLIQRVEAQLNRSAGVLPEAALDEYRDALRAYRRVAERAR
jgi:hypothetical protein